MITKERFAEGLTLSDYLAQMRTNRDRFVRAVDGAAVRPEQTAALARMGRASKLLVITEDWCGTSLAYFPPVAKLIAEHPEIEMRIFLRDDNPDVMDQFLKRGLYRSIPVFAFFDEDMHELARFTEEAFG